MLDRAVTLLKPGGMLVYCTCSLEPRGGRSAVRARHRPARSQARSVEPTKSATLAEVITPDGTIRTLASHLAGADPRLAGIDGFFIGRCQKA